MACKIDKIQKGRSCFPDQIGNDKFTFVYFQR